MNMIGKTVLSLIAAVVVGLASGCDQAEDQPWSTRGMDASRLAETGSRSNNEDSNRRQGVDPTERAVDILLDAMESEYPQLRANAIEALQYAPEHLEPAVRQGLVDENRGVRFGAAMMIGRMQMEGVAHLLEPLLEDESESVQAAAIFGMHACGQEVDLNPLARMIRSDNPEVRSNAAVVLGEIGERSAARMIRAAVGRGMGRVAPARVRIVELQMAEAMVRLGDERQLEVIRAALFSPAEQGEVTALACLICGSLRDERAVPNLLQLAQREGQRRQPAEVRMAATMAVAQIQPSQAPASVPMAYIENEEPALRAQAASTMGYLRDDESFSALRRMLRDESPLVQVAAAGAVLQRIGKAAE